MKRLLASLLIIVGFGIAQASDITVSLSDILLLSQRGVSNETILAFVENREIGFVLDAGDIDRLLEAGVSEEVIRYLLQKTASAPPTTYVPVAYVDPYPAYYYAPYYTRTSLFFGFSAFPHTSFGQVHYGAVQHNPSHNGHSVSHGNKHGVTHTGGIGHSNRSVGHRRSGGISHSGRSAVHSSRSSGNRHRSASHSRSASIGHSRSSGGHSSGGHSGGGHSSGVH